MFFTPMYRAGRIVGYYADIERYNTEGTGLPGGLNLMKLIQYEAAKAFRSEGDRLAGTLALHPNSRRMDCPMEGERPREPYLLKGVGLLG